MGAYSFHVFSGTGNSRHLVQELSARLRVRGLEAEIIEVSAAEISRLRSSGDRVTARGAALDAALDASDLDIFSFPVYAMSVPRLMNRYMRSLGKFRSAASRPKAKPSPRPSGSSAASAGSSSTAIPSTIRRALPA